MQCVNNWRRWTLKPCQRPVALSVPGCARMPLHSVYRGRAQFWDVMVQAPGELKRKENVSGNLTVLNKWRRLSVSSLGVWRKSRSLSDDKAWQVKRMSSQDMATVKWPYHVPLWLLIGYVILLTCKRGSALIIWREPTTWLSFDQAELSL